MLERIADSSAQVNRLLGQAASWAALLMVLLMTVNVLMRYLLAAGQPWQQELVQYFHALLFLAGAGYALQEGAHVRVDVFYTHFSARRQAWVDLFGSALFLWPMAVALFYFSYDYVAASWAIFEGSSEYRGMPGVFLIKSAIWLCAGSLWLAGLGMICRALLVLSGRGEATS